MFLQLPDFGWEKCYFVPLPFGGNPPKENNISSRLQIIWPFLWEIFDAIKETSTYPSIFRIRVSPKRRILTVELVVETTWIWIRKLKSIWKTWIYLFDAWKKFLAHIV